MSTKMFVNLAVKDLDRSVKFFTALGFRFNPQFTDKNATCMIVSEENFVMLLVESYFKTFTPKPVSDARKSTEVLICLSADSREEIDGMVRKAVAGGATTPTKAQDHGFMYQHGFEDLDGHLWELACMNVEAHAAQKAEAGA